MRSHAKASTAGSTQRQAKGLGHILRGAFATRGVTLPVDGSGAPQVKRLAATAIALVASFAAMALIAIPASAAPPTVLGAWSVNVVRTEATLRAEVNPQGVATTYHLEWGTTTAYGSESPERPVGSDSSPHKVSVFLDQLQPGTTYHYRVVATNGDGTSQSSDRTLTTYEVFAPDTSCPNQDFRFGPSAGLSDCRAYEMVSPVDKNGGELVTSVNIGGGRTAHNQAAFGGGKVTFSSYRAFGDALGNHYSNQYLATRGPGGWLTHSLNPPLGINVDSAYATTYDLLVQFKGFTPDLSSAWLPHAGKNKLSPDALDHYINFYRRDNSTDTYEALTVNEPSMVGLGKGFSPLELGTPELQGFTPDGTHAIFAAAAALTPDAGAHTNWQLYEFSDGELQLVSVLPGGEPNPANSNAGYVGVFPEKGSRRAHAISDDGSRIFWVATEGGGGPGKIYARIDGETTVPVSESVTPGNAEFQTASADGSDVLFSFPAGGGSGDGDFYRFNVDTETPSLVADDATGLVGTSEDLSHIYFVSQKDLADGAVAGSYNLYLDQEGTKTFITTVAGQDVDRPEPGVTPGTSIVAGTPSDRSSRVTADGSHLAFTSHRSLTDYDNTDALNGQLAREVYLYDAGSQQLVCASCNPSGARPHSRPLQAPFMVGDNDEISNNGGPLRVWTAAWLTTAENSLHTPRALSEDGNRLFFNAFDALVPEDTNGAQDVYQWEAPGSGSCQEAGGCISLISTGTNPKKSEFVDASADGSEVFFETNSSINPDDPGLVDLYVARVNGGFPVTPPPQPCVGDACQSVPAAPIDSTPASANFRGAGDPRPARDCGAAAKRAQRLKRAASQARRSSKEASSDEQARRLGRRSARLARQAERLGDSAARCRRANRRVAS